MAIFYIGFHKGLGSKYIGKLLKTNSTNISVFSIEKEEKIY